MLLARGLAREGTHVTVITLTAQGKFDDAALPFTVVRSPGLRVLGRFIYEADVVHLAGPCLVPLLLSLLLRRPAVIEHHGYQACCPNGLLLLQPDLQTCGGQFVKRNYKRCLQCEVSRLGIGAALKSLVLTALRRKLSGQAAANVAVSRHVARRLALSCSQVIFHGIPDCQPVARPREPGHVMTFGYIGRMVAEKGLSVLIAAAQNLQQEGHDFRLKMIGDGPELARLKKLSSKAGLGNRVTFAGLATGDQLETAAGDIDVVVTPSICEETAGLVTMEQMMRGRAVMAADIGGLSEIVNGAGITFAPGDPDILATRMREVILRPDLVDELGARARTRALSMFRQERMVTEHRALYDRIASA